MGFSRQDYRSMLPFPRDLPNQGWNLQSEFQADSLLSDPQAKTLGWKKLEKKGFCKLKLIIYDSYWVISSVQTLSCVQLFATPWAAAHQSSLSITNSLSRLKLMSIELVMPSNHCILCRPLLLLPSIFPSIRAFSNESAFPIRWPKYWSFSFNISLLMNTQDWSPLGWNGWISLQSKGLSRVFSSTHNSKASILQHSAFVMVWLSHPYMTTGKTVALIYGPSSAKWCLCFLTCCLGLS